MQAETQAANLPPEVRAVVEAFCNGGLPAGQVCDALHRAWASAREPEPRPLAGSHRLVPAEGYVPAN